MAALDMTLTWILGELPVALTLAVTWIQYRD